VAAVLLLDFVNTRTHLGALRRLFLIATCILSFGCGERTVPVPPPPEPVEDSTLPPRLVHRYMPTGLEKYQPEEDRWRPEAEVPRVRETTPGMVVWELTEFPPGTEPTAEQKRTADEFVERCYEAAVRHGWDRFERGLADGYRAIDTHHYRNDEYMVDGRELDPDYPEALMYYSVPPVGIETEGRQKLAGMMFYGKDREARGIQFGGPLTVWHYHSWYRSMCVVDEVGIAWSVRGKCKEGEPTHVSPEMMHVWLIDREEGPFATTMFIANRILEPLLAQRLEERGF
jgi:hypothetical protein